MLGVLFLVYSFVDPQPHSGSTPLLGAQDSQIGKPAIAVPKFEAASIRECNADDKPPLSTSSPNRLSLGCWPLWRLIADAYETFADGRVDPLKPPVPLPLEGVPDWVQSTTYTINAKSDDPQSGAMMRGPMMQALLEERFQLKTHRETREVAGYIMTVASGGLKLRSTTAGSCKHVDPTDLGQSDPPENQPVCLFPTRTSRDGLAVLDVYGISLSVFSRFLHPNGRPVIDQTGVAGVFDIHLEWEPNATNSPIPEDGVASDPSPHVSAIKATRDQLGLRLEPGRGQREVLVIDHIERPSGN
ncbi:MAG TPA: TIGR03435 family protein [Candidatus Solibacter sp.]|nr:TIGR03435 family protein [Candidatus Solibacter sp.]